MEKQNNLSNFAAKFYKFFQMKHLRLVCVVIAIALSGNTIKAGGILTNTNQNIAFNRNFARDGVIAIDGVYSNPAGVAFLSNGFHLSLNWQMAFQTRTINSGLTVPAFAGTPFEKPFTMNGGDADGIKTFKGEATVPFIPSFQAAYNTDKWGFQASFALTGGGGKCKFDNGLASFERQVAMLPGMLYAVNSKILASTGMDLGLGSSTPSYSVNSFLNGQQYALGLQLGVTYKINEHIAVYAGGRFTYNLNKYEGQITDISANIAGENQNLYQYFGNMVSTYSANASALSQKASAASAAGDEATAAALTQKAALCTQVAGVAETTKASVADRYISCKQTGWGIQPIIGIDYKAERFNIGARLEFTNHYDVTNKTTIDDTGMFADGAKTPSDMPGLFTVGAQYEVLPTLRVMGGFHYFFDKNADMTNNKQRHLDGNTTEYLAGVEWDITDKIMVSAGGQRTNYGLGDGEFLSDMSFSLDSYSAGFGAKVRLSDKVALNVAYFWTMYDSYDKSYNQAFQAAGQEISMQCTDHFKRTNRVLGAGIDIDF